MVTNYESDFFKLGARLNQLQDLCEKHGENLLDTSYIRAPPPPPPLLLDDFLSFNLNPTLSTCDAIEAHLASLACNTRSLRKEMSEMSDAYKEVIMERNSLRTRIDFVDRRVESIIDDALALKNQK